MPFHKSMNPAMSSTVDWSESVTTTALRPPFMV